MGPVPGFASEAEKLVGLGHGAGALVAGGWGMVGREAQGGVTVPAPWRGYWRTMGGDGGRQHGTINLLYLWKNLCTTLIMTGGVLCGPGVRVPDRGLVVARGGATVAVVVPVNPGVGDWGRGRYL